jgi:hypothetical protein
MRETLQIPLFWYGFWSFSVLGIVIHPICFNQT